MRTHEKAPTNDAFDALPMIDSILLPDNIDQLKKIVLQHVVCGWNTRTSLSRTVGDLMTINGNYITVTTDDSNTVMVNDSNIINTEIIASNGVIHIIDSVLLPSSFSSSPGYEEGCLPDRFDNEQMELVDPSVNFNKLYPGQFICSKPYDVNQYRFGVTRLGNVVWKNTIAGESETEILFENTASHTNIYFSLRIDATMVITDETTGLILWESAPVNLKHPMSHYPQCLKDPYHDCPYFHLHSDGVMVLNYIPNDGAGWQAKNLFQVYDKARK